LSTALLSTTVPDNIKVALTYRGFGGGSKVTSPTVALIRESTGGSKSTCGPIPIGTSQFAKKSVKSDMNKAPKSAFLLPKRNNDIISSKKRPS